MEEKYIGVIDSGLGGLTVVDLLKRQYPSENIVFVGDNKNSPYGDKTSNQIKELVEKLYYLISQFDLKALLVACNTMDSNAIEVLKNISKVDVYPIIYPTSLEAVKQTKNKRIAVMATKAAIDTNCYKRTIKSIDDTIEVHQISCPKLVPKLENSLDCTSDLVQYLNQVNIFDVDTIILGCTHYPLLTKQIKELINPDINIVSSSQQLVNSLDIKPKENKKGIIKYYVTSNPKHFSEVASKLFNYPIEAELLKDID